MKKIFLLFAIVTIAVSCKDEVDHPTYQGEFVHVDDGAVLKGTNFIYGVILDDVAMELSERVKPAKENEFDMVPVVVKGVVSSKQEGEEGWDEVLTITEILEVSSHAAEADIKIQENKN